MFEISILAKNLIKSYFEEVGNEDTPILDKFDKLIGKYLKGASCDACLTNLHGYLSEMWDKGLNEKLIHEFIEELTKYVDESTASKINKGLKFTESLEESKRSLKESKYSIKFEDFLMLNNEDYDEFKIYVNDVAYGNLYKKEILKDYAELLRCDVVEWCCASAKGNEVIVWLE